MKNKLAFTASIAALIAALSWPGNADTARRAASANADIVPEAEVLATVRAAGLSPSDRVIRRGDFYLLHAIDPHGNKVRVVADAVLGDILSVTGANPVVPAYAARYDSGPRIIHVPDRRVSHDRMIDQSRVLQPNYNSAVDDDDDRPVAALPNTRRVAPAGNDAMTPSKRRQGARAPEPGSRRSVLNVPPSIHDGPSPIKPTPHWRSANQFNAPTGAGPETTVPAAPGPGAADAPTNQPAGVPVAPDDDVPPDGPTLDAVPPIGPPAPGQ